mmetsp:Transcript_19505/g.26972  ORF Transcript_19505/g.26972 Transcript_19505/m.26972 type:complete len:785 (-) Transcript_19505:323-2677(-)
MGDSKPAAGADSLQEEVSLRPGGGVPPGLSLRPGGGMSMGSYGMMSSTATRKKETPLPRSKEFGGERLVYSKETLLEFKLRFVQLPAELANSNIEIVLNEPPASEPHWGTEREPQQGGPSQGQGSREKPDGRDWRTRTDLPPAREDPRAQTGNQRGQSSRGRENQGNNRPQPAPMPSGPGPDIKKADTPWQIGQSKSDTEKLLRSVKGILNKITPEKFEKLSDQIVNIGITTADLLHKVISLIFDKAVAEPTFCQLYSRLCVKLSKALPEFPPAEGEDKPMTFRRILLNTCQEEFEGATAQRAAAMQEIAEGGNLTPEEKEFKLRLVKLKTLGNIRLIGELFKEKMIMEKILHACITDLLGKPRDVPPDENVEALCNLLTTVGKNLDLAPRSKAFVEGYFQRLNNFTKNESMPSRIRFMCKDVIDLRLNKWVPRTKKLEAMTIDEVHATAAKEMGIQRPMRGPAPQQQQQHMMPQGTGAHLMPGGHFPGMPGLDDGGMFPEGPVKDDGWEVVGKKKMDGSQGGYSALTGPYVPSTNFQRPPAPGTMYKPPPPAQSAPAATAPPLPTVPPPASTPAPASAPKAKILSADELEKKLDNLLEEFLSVQDSKEVLLALEEFTTSGLVEDKASMGEKLARKTVELIVDKGTEKAGIILTDLVVAIAQKGVCTWENVEEPIKDICAQMEDLAMDAPKAPMLIANCVASCILNSDGKITLETIKKFCEPIEDIFTRRDVAVAMFKALKSKGPFTKMCMETKLDINFLMDEPGLEELKEYLVQVDLTALIPK